MPVHKNHGAPTPWVSSGTQVSTLAGTLSGGSITLNNTFDAFDASEGLSNPYVASYKMIEISQDLLVLSCSLFRTKSTQGILDRSNFENITDEDVELAEKIRNYYSSKLTIWSLVDKELSPFRKDLYSYLTGPSRVFQEKMLPLVYRIPCFYEYDTMFDQLKTGLQVTVPEGRRSVELYRECELFPLGKTHKVRKLKRNRYEYWFKDSNCHMYLLSVDDINPLIPLLNREFHRKSMRVNGCFSPKTRNDIGVYVLSGNNWEIL